MKKTSLIIMLAFGTSTILFAQDAKTKSDDKTGHATEVKTVATQSEQGEEKGKLVSEAAKSKSQGQSENRKDAEMKSTAGEKGKATSEDAKPKSANQENAEKQESGKNTTADSHGKDVKAVATDENLSGKEKGDAVKSTATVKGDNMKNERAVSRQNGARSEKSMNKGNSARPERAARPAGAKRPATAGRPAATGRPGM